MPLTRFCAAPCSSASLRSTIQEGDWKGNTKHFGLMEGLGAIQAVEDPKLCWVDLM